MEWNFARADGNVAMIYNDSIVVGYSALTNTFSALSYTGSLVSLSGDEYGCIDNFAFFVTDQLFYVFDAEDATWRSYNYTPPVTPVSGGGVRGKADYIYLDLWVTNDSPHTIVAYSLLTKTFAELTEPALYYFTDLDHGFTFYRGTPDPPYLCGGYSAITGLFSIKTHGRQIAENWPDVHEELVTPLVCNLFITNQQISGNNYRYFMWVYNTMTGDFAEYTFEYTYNNSNYYPVGSVCGGQTALTVINNKDAGDKIEFVVYSAPENSFVHFDTPLFYWGLNGYGAGGLIIDSYDEQTFFLYDVVTQASYTHPVRWTQGFMPYVRAHGWANYWTVFAHSEINNDTVHVISYNTPDAALYTFDIIGNVSSSVYRGYDLFGLLTTDMGSLAKTYLYAPLHSNWTEKDIESSNFRGAEGNYFYANYPEMDLANLYDAVTDQEYWFAEAQMASHVLARDNYFFMYSTAGKYIGYSMNKHEFVEYEIARFAGQQWGDFIVLNHSGSSGTRLEHVLYDSYNNIYAPLTLTAEQGFRVASWPGGKTAFVASKNGYLFAYYPGEITSISDDLISPDNLSHKLHQNYPNPFTTHTKIKYSISSAAMPESQNKVSVTLRVYNSLGSNIATLVNEQKSAGDYEVEFNTEGLTAGIYFYTLMADDFVQTQKLILLK